MNLLDFKKLRHSAQDLTPQHRHIFATDLQNAHQRNNPVLEQIDHAFSEHPRCFQLSTRGWIPMGTGSGTPALPMWSLPRQFTPLINTPLAETGEVGK